MCNCTHNTCPHCDPGIEAYFQKKVQQAKEAAKAYEESVGHPIDYEILLDDAKDIWYEYCELKANAEADDAFGDGDPSQWTY
jgi:hypothetical protein